MKQKSKRIFAMVAAAVMCMSVSVFAFAAEKELSPYEEILNEANREFDLDLGYVPVDEEKVSLEDYKEKTYQFAAEQRELLDYIASREESPAPTAEAKSSVVKTKEKPTWNLGEYFKIKATYTVYNGNRISACRNASLNMTNMAILTNTYLTSISGPTYSVIDSGRTSTVKYTATVHFESLWGYSNTTLYTEFYYSE